MVGFCYNEILKIMMIRLKQLALSRCFYGCFIFLGPIRCLHKSPAVADSVSINEPVYRENEVDVLPVYKNGMVQFFKFLSEKINIPDDAFKSSVNGSVILSFYC